MHRRAQPLLWSWILIASACGGGSVAFRPDGGGAHDGPATDGPSVDPMTADKACQQSAAAGCARLDACRKSGVLLRYGDMTTCVARQKLSCLAALRANGTGLTPAHVMACATSTMSASCSDYLSGAISACDTQPGSLPPGSVCAFSAQCASGFCAVRPDANCGVCASPTRPGEACTNGDCVHGQLCGRQSMTCLVPGQTGAVCGAASECAPSYECVGFTKTSTGICQRAIEVPGSACDRKVGPPCNFDAQLYCLSPAGMTIGQCTAYIYAGQNEPCGFLGNAYALCRAGGNCYGSPSTCKDAASDGAACDTMNGPPCLAPARCVVAGGGTAGTCQLADAATCP